MYVRGLSEQLAKELSERRVGNVFTHHQAQSHIEWRESDGCIRVLSVCLFFHSGSQHDKTMEVSETLHTVHLNLDCLCQFTCVIRLLLVGGNCWDLGHAQSYS